MTNSAELARATSLVESMRRGSINPNVDTEHLTGLVQTNHADEVRNEIDDYDQIVADAKKATEDQITMTLREGIRRYPRAIMWSVLLSAALIMEGYDTNLLGSLYGQKQFARAYGHYNEKEDKYIISAAWQAGLSNGANVGSLAGLTFNGWASERFGYRITIMCSLIMMTGVIFFPVFAEGRLPLLLVGQILSGIPWGVFQTLTTAYASEICPVSLRPYLTAYVNLCWVMGQFISSGVLRGVLSWDSDWAFRLPFALQWLWPVPLAFACWFAPDSPWWEVRHGRHDRARAIVRRLIKDPSDQEVEETVAMMIHTNAVEKAISEGTSYADCFRGVDRRRTGIAAGTWAVQNLCGSAFMGYSTFFLLQAGLPDTSAFSFSMGNYAIGFVGTIASWFIMPHVGRRRIYISGLIAMAVILIVIGFMGIVTSMNAKMAIGAMLVIYTAVYDISVGPACYALVAELSSTRLRAKTVVIARMVYNIIAIINAVIMPYFLNTEQLNWGGKTGWFWGGMCGLCAVWCYFFLPEPKGRTYGELDILFENRVPARKFRTTMVDQFAEHGNAVSTVAKNEEKPDITHVDNVQKM